MEKQEYVSKILHLKKEKSAILLAHYYQEPAIQDIADFTGDSLGLAKEAAKTKAEIIVFAGVYFMAEVAKIFNPTKKVLLPDINAGCSLADSCPPDQFEKFIRQHQDHYVITYVNCSAEVKAMSDIVCTSSNAIKIVESLPKKQKIVFAPDKNLGAYINQLTGRKMVLWDGACIVHEAFSFEKLAQLFAQNSDAEIIAHPESEKHILDVAHYVGSTAGMIKYVKSSPAIKFIVATEAGILYRMQQEAPNKILVPAPAKEDNSCACSECAFMKMNTLSKIYDCLMNESPEILLPRDVAQKAILPLEKMLQYS